MRRHTLKKTCGDLWDWSAILKAILGNYLLPEKTQGVIDGFRAGEEESTSKRVTMIYGGQLAILRAIIDNCLWPRTGRGVPQMER